MISKFTKKYIMEKAEKEGLTILSNYEEVLEKYCQVVSNYGYKLRFGKGRSMSWQNLGANAGVFKKSSILVTPEWAFQLLTNKDNVDLAFRITLGHELTHKEKDLFCLFNVKFCAWVNEVHADFGATEKMFNGDRRILLEAIDFKFRYLVEHQKDDKEDFTHPSWMRRKYYAENFDFNAELIQRIATDVGCSNQKLIDKMCKHYEEIILNDNGLVI